MQFSDLIGEMVLVLIPHIDTVKLQNVRIVGVEAGGIWIEHQGLTNTILSALKAASAPKMLVFFLPFHAISYAATGIEGVSLDETAFGA